MRTIGLFRTLAITSALMLGLSGAAFAEDPAPEEAGTPSVDAEPAEEPAQEPAEQPAEGAEEAPEAEQAEQPEPGM